MACLGCALLRVNPGATLATCKRIEQTVASMAKSGSDTLAATLPDLLPGKHFSCRLSPSAAKNTGGNSDSDPRGRLSQCVPWTRPLDHHNGLYFYLLLGLDCSRVWTVSPSAYSLWSNWSVLGPESMSPSSKYRCLIRVGGWKACEMTRANPIG
ncbi:hypothetical protein GGS24DRAFT_77225 [Hypoxylon argillaceum]|nr:hypothetical protein GGS24DRAFT_77225 [Hypoxylon argillaceum]